MSIFGLHGPPYVHFKILVLIRKTVFYRSLFKALQSVITVCTCCVVSVLCRDVFYCHNIYILTVGDDHSVLKWSHLHINNSHLLDIQKSKAWNVRLLSVKSFCFNSYILRFFFRNKQTTKQTIAKVCRYG